MYSKNYEREGRVIWEIMQKLRTVTGEHTPMPQLLSWKSPSLPVFSLNVPITLPNPRKMIVPGSLHPKHTLIREEAISNLLAKLTRGGTVSLLYLDYGLGALLAIFGKPKKLAAM
jgi:hypothetical protein